MKLKIFGIFLCGLFILLIKGYRETISFDRISETIEQSELIYFDRRYIIERTYSDGSGQYVNYTVFKLKDNQKQQVAEFTTCGRLVLKDNIINFYEPEEFHCGVINSKLYDWFTPKISSIEFTAEGEKITKSNGAETP